MITKNEELLRGHVMSLTDGNTYLSCENQNLKYQLLAAREQVARLGEIMLTLLDHMVETEDVGLRDDGFYFWDKCGGEIIHRKELVRERTK